MHRRISPLGVYRRTASQKIQGLQQGCPGQAPDPGKAAEVLTQSPRPAAISDIRTGQLRITQLPCLFFSARSLDISTFIALRQEACDGSFPMEHTSVPRGTSESRKLNSLFPGHSYTGFLHKSTGPVPCITIRNGQAGTRNNAEEETDDLQKSLI